MSDVAQRFHENWLGLVQPIDGLVVSIPALVAAECMEHQPPAVQRRLIELCRNVDTAPCIVDLWAFLEEMLQLGRDAFDVGDALPEDLHLYVPEGGQTLRPTAGLRKLDDGGASEPVTMDDSTPASRAGSKYEMLLWQLPDGLALDKPETQTGSWEYPPAAKFDRLLRECRVPIGLLTNGQHVRLVVAPHGESSGAITFRLEDMVQVGGRAILDGFIMLLSDHRWFGAEPGRRLPAILKDSRARQADVTNTLADQMFEALTILLQGFEAAAERDGDTLLRQALAQEGDHVYEGLLTLLLRLVFVLYAEDRGLMPVEHEVYGKHLSVLALFDSLQADNGAFPDTMSRRFGAYPRLLALFRAVFYGVRAGKLTMPPRRGVLFDPGEYPFLEGAGSGAPAIHPAERAELAVPSVSDETIHRVLQKLLVLGGQRLSYRALEVEQIGSVYEGLMGYGVHRCASASVCLRGAKVWVGAAEVRDLEPGRRAKWLEELGLAKAQAKKIADALAGAKSEREILAVLEGVSAAKIPTACAGRLVIQPGEERRRTRSHYTPRSLTEPIVRRTLEPLILAIGGQPRSDKLLRLKICDPAMGSGAFLVAACRFLADQVVAAWTRERDEDGDVVLRKIVASHDDPVMHARRLVAQKCLYGVDKNPFAVTLAKLSLWLETLAKHEPFTFVDHALKCGDSLVGLSIPQIKRFEWAVDTEVEGKVAKKGKRGHGTQLGLFDSVIERALLRAHAARRRLLELAEAKGDHVAIGGEKSRLHAEAEFALERARVIGDVLLGAFFAKESEKARVKEAGERKGVVESWLGATSDSPAPDELLRWLAEIRETQRPFHWGLEFPEVFWEDGSEPLEASIANPGARGGAYVDDPPLVGSKRRSGSLNPQRLGFDAFVANPPYIDAVDLSDEQNAAQYKGYCKANYGAASGSFDVYVLFAERVLLLSRLGGTAGLLLPNKILSAEYARDIRRIITQTARVDTVIDVSMGGDFDAAVYPVALVLQVGDATSPAAVLRSLDGPTVSVAQPVFNDPPDYLWGYLLTDYSDLVADLLKRTLRLDSIATASGAATVGEAYAISKYVRSGDGNVLPGHFKFVVSGNIRAFQTTWLEADVRYLKSVYTRPTIDAGKLPPTRARQSSSPKVILSGMALRPTAFFDERGEYCAGKSTVLIFEAAHADILRPLCSILNSKIGALIYKALYGGLAMSGGYFRFGAPQMAAFPLPAGLVGCGKHLSEMEIAKLYAIPASAVDAAFSRNFDESPRV